MKVEREVIRNGRLVRLDERVAKVLEARGKIRLPTNKTGPVPVYETRSIEADEPDISPRTGQPKRQYRRRDLTPEG